MEKLCVFCTNHVWDRPYSSTGCPTCGPETYGGFSCRANHYSEVLPYSEDEYRKLLLKADTCKDYSPAISDATQPA